MKRFILDIFDRNLNEDEAQEYFKNSFTEMGDEEKSYYLGNEDKYLKFFLALFAIKEKASTRIRFCNYKKATKLLFDAKYSQRILENLLRAKSITCQEDIEIFTMLSFRDAFGVQFAYRIYFSGIRIYIASLSDYCYMVYCKDESEEIIKRMAIKFGLYLSGLPKFVVN